MFDEYSNSFYQTMYMYNNHYAITDIIETPKFEVESTTQKTLSAKRKNQKKKEWM